MCFLIVRAMLCSEDADVSTIFTPIKEVVK
jgi:hypothetical protein